MELKHRHQNAKRRRSLKPAFQDQATEKATQNKATPKQQDPERNPSNPKVGDTWTHKTKNGSFTYKFEQVGGWILQGGDFKMEPVSIEASSDKPNTYVSESTNSNVDLRVAKVEMELTSSLENAIRNGRKDAGRDNGPNTALPGVLAGGAYGGARASSSADDLLARRWQFKDNIYAPKTTPIRTPIGTVDVSRKALANTSKGLKYGGYGIGAYNSVVMIMNYQDYTTFEMAMEQGSNAFATFGGIPGAAWGVGWEIGRYLTQRPWYIDFKNDVALPWLWETFGKPGEQ